MLRASSLMITPKPMVITRSTSATANLSSSWSSGLRTVIPWPLAQIATGDSLSASPRPAGRSGWVITATRSCALTKSASRVGRATSGVAATAICTKCSSRTCYAVKSLSLGYFRHLKRYRTILIRESLSSLTFDLQQIDDR